MKKKMSPMRLNRSWEWVVVVAAAAAVVVMVVAVAVVAAILDEEGSHHQQQQRRRRYSKPLVWDYFQMGWEGPLTPGIG